MLRTDNINNINNIIIFIHGTVGYKLINIETRGLMLNFYNTWILKTPQHYLFKTIKHFPGICEVHELKIFLHSLRKTIEFLRF